jgi:hypothetical protein
MAIRSFNDLNKNQQLAVLIGVPAVVAITLGVLIYRSMGVLGPDPDDSLPGFLHRSLPGNKWEQINKLDKQIAEKQVIINRRQKVEEELKSLESDIKAGRDRLPLESEKAEMRLLIEKLARDIPSDIGTVLVKSVKITENTSAGASRQASTNRSGASKPEQVTYQTEISGDINGIIKYVDMIEKNPRFMLVNSFSLTPGKISTDAEKRTVLLPHEVKMNIITYVYNPGSGSAAAAAGGKP